MSATAIVVHAASIDWASKARDLDARGWALLPTLITQDQCRQMSALYARDAAFRSRVVMSRHGFGRGEYQYFAYPLPDLVQTLRTSLYARLVPIANAWESTSDFPRLILNSSPVVTMRVRPGRRHCYCSTVPATTIACIRTYTASTFSRCKSRSSSPGRPKISTAVNSY